MKRFNAFILSFVLILGLGLGLSAPTEVEAIKKPTIPEMWCVVGGGILCVMRCCYFNGIEVCDPPICPGL